MNAPLFMGIDGGGSRLRIAIVDSQLRQLCAIKESAANPSLVGHDTAATTVQRGIARALQQLALQPAQIAAAGIGIAGASSLHSRDWLLQTIQPALPKSLLVPSSDLEIALVGALAQPCGILLLAGTGSAVYGIAPDGSRLQIGGWGYLLGDEGSGFWIGMRLLRRITALHDQAGSIQNSALARKCLDRLGLADARDLVAWLYHRESAPGSGVAALAELALEAAEHGDEWAHEIVLTAADKLVAQVLLMRQRLDWSIAPIAFAGGLLDKDNRLSQTVARKLQLNARPVAKHAPVIGAAMLAQAQWSGENAK